MKAIELKQGQRFAYYKLGKWSIKHRIAEIIDLEIANNLFIKTASGKTLVIAKDSQVKLTD